MQQERFAALGPAVRDFQAATHIRDLSFGDVADPVFEFEEPAAPVAPAP